MEIRLQKFLADAGVASRRASEKLISEGKVKVNGKIINQQGIKVNPDKDIIEYNSKVITLKQKFVYYMLNKPVKVVSTVSDEKNRTTVIDLIKSKERIFPIGRLDYMSSGLLLLTNDGDLTYKLTHPKHHINKKYIVTVTPKPTKNKIDILQKGVDLGIYKTSECKITLLNENGPKAKYEVIIHEGKNRQIRNMFKFINSEVISLKRVAIGNIKIGKLKPGEYRQLTKQEIDYLKKI